MGGTSAVGGHCTFTKHSLSVCARRCLGVPHVIAGIRLTVRARKGRFLMERRLAMIAFAAFAFAVPNVTHAQQQGASLASSALEEIYVARSVRLSRVPASSFCDKSNTEVNRANNEDQYIFRAVATNPTDGSVTDADSTTVGTIHACFGPTDNPENVQFYGEFMFQGMAFKGFGDCTIRQDFPEKGVGATRCYLNLFGLPDRYAGGQLVTNTINTPKRLIGTVTDPVGYAQSSIATVRLWKKRI